MTKNVNLARIAIVLLFALTFTMVGWLSPVLYATYVPDNQVMEVNNFEAQDTTTESDRHYICFDRTVHQGASARTFAELYVVDNNDERIEVGSEEMQSYFQEGESEIIMPFRLPDELRSGDYRYVLVIRMELADGRVTRDFIYESNTFSIDEGPAKDESRPMGC